jgi:hypothetical protein
LKDVAQGLKRHRAQSSAKVDVMLGSAAGVGLGHGLQALATNQLHDLLRQSVAVLTCGHTMCNTYAAMLNGVCFVCEEHFDVSLSIG